MLVLVIVNMLVYFCQVEVCLMLRSVKRCPHNAMLGHREVIYGKVGSYKWRTYEEVHVKQSIGSGMRGIGVKPIEKSQQLKQTFMGRSLGHIWIKLS
ncbi:long chain acyl-CoA synthetase 2 [Iris pallida]|uniref:Long chain acyl-CoA synthetase 2 n=1 Tax=Iris pallida TaxID=29817 RepID=A0AAX6DGX9_IRIPA|nr:long chain acyl-CoA synthetase 2 [Iris pallida]